jgi:hypothetical protein
VIGQSLTGPKFASCALQLIDATEWTLRARIEDAAAAAGMGHRHAWSEVVRLYGGTFWRSTISVPCGDIIRAYQQAYGKPLDAGLRAQLVERALSEPRSDFALAMLLADRAAAYLLKNIDENMTLIRGAWESRIYIQRINALEFARAMRPAIDEAGPDANAAMRRMLEGFQTNNLFVNTVLLETLSAYGGLNIGMDAEDAAFEMRALIRPGVVANAEIREIAAQLQVQPATFLANQARGCLDKMWEDVFQNVYWDAYAILSSVEKFDLLTLALSEGERDGMFMDWKLRELLNLDDSRAVITFRRFAADIEAPSPFPQQATATYIRGIEGCARWDAAPVQRPISEEAVRAAWHAIGDILFWLYKDLTGHREAISSLWRRVDGQVLLAAGDVLHQLASSRWRSPQEQEPEVNLVALFPDEARRIAEGCLNHEGALPSVFMSNAYIDEQVIRFLIGVLGRCGNGGSLTILKVYAEIDRFGHAAVEAIQLIQQRILQSAASLAQ